jgi:hypothetical protein
MRILSEIELKTEQSRGAIAQHGAGASKDHRNGVKTRENDPPNFFFFSPSLSSSPPLPAVRKSVPAVKKKKIASRSPKTLTRPFAHVSLHHLG